MTTELDLKKLLTEWAAADDNEHDDLECVDEGEWEQDGKYQHCATVYRHKPTGRFVSIYQSRSGSYHSDWYYNDPDIEEVFPETKTITVYRVKPVPAKVSAPPAPSPGTP